MHTRFKITTIIEIKQISNNILYYLKYTPRIVHFITIHIIKYIYTTLLHLDTFLNIHMDISMDILIKLNG